MYKFEYNGKTYLKIKQDWYSEIGEKLPLKIAVTLDAEFNAKLIENEQSIVKLLDQTRYFLSIGSTKRAHEVVIEALSLATKKDEQTQFLPSVIVMFAQVIKALERYQDGIDQIEAILEQEPEAKHNAQVMTALASLYVESKQAKQAIALAHDAMIAFRKSKRKVSDDLMIVWSQLKKSFPEEYKDYREQLKQTGK
jgi:phage shock protein A